MKGAPILLLFTGAIALLVSIGTISLFIYTTIIYGPVPIRNSDEEKILKVSVKEAVNKIKFYKFDRMVLNILSPDKRPRYLDLEIQLLLLDDTYTNLIERKKPIILDRIIEIVSVMGVQELNSVTGKIILEERIKKIITESTGKPLIKSAYFTSFIVK